MWLHITSLVGLPGLEPGKTGPESVVLPLHHSPIFQQNHPFRFWRCKDTAFYLHSKLFQLFFCPLTLKKYSNLQFSTLILLFSYQIRTKKQKTRKISFPFFYSYNKTKYLCTLFFIKQSTFIVKLNKNERNK